MLFALSLASAATAATPALLTLVNLREYREPPIAAHSLPSITVIVPARNEEAGIAACVESLLRSTGIAVHVLVLDDASTDATSTIVQAIAHTDARLHLLPAATLPAGWNGKQHACWQGAQAADTPLLCFVDADVRLQPETLARMATLLVHGDGRPSAAPALSTHVANATVLAAPGTAKRSAALVSGFPWEQTGTPLEWLLLPLIHFVLLGLLPMRFLRLTTAPGLAAGCGQFLLVDRTAYFAAGGHAAMRETMHDGLRLPRLLLAHGYPTRLADLTTLARCRMYTSGRATWNGLAKNATEGLGAPAAIVPMTLLLGIGQVLPLPLLVVALARLLIHRANQGATDNIHPSSTTSRDIACVALAAAAVGLSYLPRAMQARRFHHPRRSVALHPIAVATLLTLQWTALARKLLGKPATWKSRDYQAN